MNKTLQKRIPLNAEIAAFGDLVARTLPDTLWNDVINNLTLYLKRKSTRPLEYQRFLTDVLTDINKQRFSGHYRVEVN